LLAVIIQAINEIIGLVKVWKYSRLPVSMRQKQLQYNLVKFFGTAAGAYGEEKAKTERQRNGFDSHTTGD
jgi:hypothetical protein